MERKEKKGNSFSFSSSHYYCVASRLKSSWRKLVSSSSSGDERRLSTVRGHHIRRLLCCDGGGCTNNDRAELSEINKFQRPADGICNGYIQRDEHHPQSPSSEIADPDVDALFGRRDS